MERLLKRRKLQECLEETEKEMGDGCMSLNELESLLNEEGIDTKIENLPSRRIASDNTTRYLFISNVHQALADAKKRETNTQKQADTNEPSTSASINQSELCKPSDSQTSKSPKYDELEDDLQRAIQMSLECMDESETSVSASKTDESWTSYLTDSDYSDDESDGYEPPDMSSAKAYIKQYSDFTHKAIDGIVAPKEKNKSERKKMQIDKIIEELGQDKTIIDDNVQLSSSDDEDVIEETLSENANIKTKVQVTSNENIKATGNNVDDMNDTQASVIFVENSENQFISLESSLDDISELNDQKLTSEKEVQESSSSSEDEFEEVSDNDQKPNEPVVELTLNMGAKIEDDIFADIFDAKDDNNEKTNATNITECFDKEKIKEEDKNKDNNVKIQETELNKESQTKTTITKTEELAVSVEKCDTQKMVTDRISSDESKNKGTETETVETPKTKKAFENEIITTEKLNTMVTEIENEEEELLQEKGRLDRIGRNITEEITKEAQELLRVFGIPYIVAPMEAEAQCAFLENVKLTDGTITDDSDIWLFGGQTVYKNFFNQKKHVLQYLSERIEKSFSK